MVLVAVAVAGFWSVIRISLYIQKTPLINLPISPFSFLHLKRKMVDEIESESDREAMLHEMSKKSLAKLRPLVPEMAKKIVSSNGTSSSNGSYAAHKSTPEATNHGENTDLDDHSKGFSSNIDKNKLTDLVKTKDLQGLLQMFNDVRGWAKALQTNLEHGINGDDTKRRITVFGSNSYKQPPPKGVFYCLVEAMKDPTKLLQLLDATISLGLGIKKDEAKKGWFDNGISIFFSLLIIALSAVANFIKKRQIHHSSKICNNIQIDVVREGKRQKISIFEVVVGDVVVLNIGDRIPADGLFIDGQSLSVDESSMMTGTSDFIEIDARNPLLISGSKVVDGHARMLVISVGMNTAWGKMMSSKPDDDSDEQTPLQSRLNKLTTVFGKLACLLAFLDLMAIAIRSFPGGTNKGNWYGTDTLIPFVTGAVLAIAEALSLALTVIIVYSAKGMMGDDQAVVVKNLSACETMGSATVICTHKTGILTMNQMEVTKFWVGLDHVEDDSSIDAKIVQLYHQGVGLNTNGSVYRSSSDSGTTSEYSGSPTEKALLSWADKNLGMDIEKEKRSCTILRVEPFKSENQQSRVFIRKEEDKTLHVHIKGAPEVVLAMCSDYYEKSGLIKSLNQEERTYLEKIIAEMGARGLRCIAFAHKQISEMKPNGEIPLMTWLGIVGIKNPCVPGVKEGVETLKNARVGVKLITADNIFTAKAIATECGILEAGPHVSNNGEVIEGKDFRNYTEEERMNRVDNIRVMARASPSDKLLMVQCLKKKGHVVAVTGHRANDAPALKEADIGLSMGIGGTEVAKESSDVVIDNFTSIVKVSIWGRCVFHNLQKIIQFQLPSNLAAFVVNFISDARGRGVPLTPVQMLWVNLVLVTFGALALAIQKPTKYLMLQKPPPVLGITNVMWRNLLAQSLYQIVILLIIWFKIQSFFEVNESVQGTITFTTFTLCQLFNLFNSRNLEKMNVFEGLHKNKTFMGIVGLVILLQVVKAEFLKIVADTEKLNMMQWGICIAFAALSCPIALFVKLIPVPEAPFLSYRLIMGRHANPQPAC